MGSNARSRQRPSAGPGDRGARGRILVVDDEAAVCRALRWILESDGHGVDVAAGPGSAERAWRDADLDLVLLDPSAEGPEGPEGPGWLEALRARRPELEVVVMTDTAGVESAARSMRRGASDYVAKPFHDLRRLRSIVRRAVDRSRGRRLGPARAARSAELVGSGPQMSALRRMIADLHANESHVLITGESGTGKERVAAAIHEASPRRDGPFVSLRCGALSPDEAGSALVDGAFGEATGGSLHLHEVGDLSLEAQPLLLRALDASRAQAPDPGASRPGASGSAGRRIIASSQGDLSGRVEEGAFRADLFYRLDVIRIELAPLRERRGDIPELAEHFVRLHRPIGSRVAGLAADAVEALVSWSWPGNVRELENTIESALALAQGPLLRAHDLSGRGSDARLGLRSVSDAALPLSLEAYEKRALERALAECQGDAARAARALGIGRSTLYRKLAKHGLRARPGDPAASRAGVGGSEAIR
ncbi:MAG: sigma-54-dependent transcriptional regulator [Myxococcota bacterium]